MGNEPAGDAVGEPLDRRLGCLGVFDELHDLASAVSFPDARGAEGDAARRVQSPTDDFVAGLLADRDRFACQHRLVDGRTRLP